MQDHAVPPVTSYATPANLITAAGLCCSLAAGCLAAAGLRHGMPPPHARLAAVLILAGAACDACDGPVARATTGPTPFGKRLDSYADLLGGIAAALLLYSAVLCRAGWLALPAAAFIPPAAFRLTRFDTTVRDPYRFCGLPVPAATLPLSGLAAGHAPALPAACTAAVLAALMASTVPFPTLAALPALLSRAKEQPQ